MTETPSQPKSSGFLKSFFIVIALILFGILIGVLAAKYIPMSGDTVVPTPTPAITETPTPTIDETANWQIYSNDIYKYQIKYPTEWTIQEKNNNIELISQERKTRFANSTNGTNESSYDVLIRVDQKKEGETILKKYHFDNPDSISELVSNDIDFTWYLIQSDPPYVVYVTEKLNRFYALFFDGEGLTQIQNQILSTFKFTEQLPSITAEQLSSGWYWGTQGQKLSGTPTTWVYQDAGRSSCWHKPGVTCVASGYICPTTERVDCVDGPNNPELRMECTSEYLEWATANCPGFKAATF